MFVALDASPVDSTTICPADPGGRFDSICGSGVTRIGVVSATAAPVDAVDAAALAAWRACLACVNDCGR